MGSRLKEDEKNERIIRGLLKQPSNRKCINCNILAGGNEHAREIYFKEWDPQRHSAPNSSNVDRLRDFIKHVYVDRRYAGERSIDRPSQGDKEEPVENRRSDGYQSGSRSPPYDDTYERRYSDRASPGYDVRSSPSYGRDNQRHSDYGRSPVRSGVVNDWRREDRFANGRKSEDRRSSDGESKSEMRSPDNQKDSNISSPPVARPVRDILGDNVIPLRISEPPKSHSSRVADGPTFTQRTASSSSLASSNDNAAELKRETSLIDFDAEPEPPMAAATQTQQSNATQSVTQSTSEPSDGNWACFDSVPENKMSQVPPSSNSLESVLTQLSVPTSAPVSGAASNNAGPAPSNDLFSLSTGGEVVFASVGNATTAAFPRAPAAALPVTSLSSFPSGGATAAPGLLPTLPVNGGTGQWSELQHNQHPFPHDAANQPATRPQPSSFPSSSSNQGLTGNPVTKASQAVTNPAAQTVEVKSNGRRELPVDLFTATYSSIPYQAPGWQAGFIPGMGYHMQFNPAMAMHTFPQPSKSANPFDVNAEASSVQAATFPSMSSLHAALPNTAAPRGLVHAPNLGTAMPSWIPPQSSSYPSTVPPIAQSFASTMQGGNSVTQLPNNMVPSWPQGFGSFGGERAAFGSMIPDAATPNPSLGGNPFG